MPTKDVPFDPSGDPIEVEIRRGYDQEGSYVLTLWEGRTVVKRWEGDFLSDDDRYELPGSAADHDGRKLECAARLNIEPPVDGFSLDMILTQSGEELDVVSDEGRAEPGSLHPVNLFANLEAS